MTRDQVIAILLARAGQRQNDLVLEASLKTEIVAVQNEFEANAFLPWFLVQTTDSLTLSAGQDEISIPSSFLRELDEQTRAGALYRQDTTQADPWVPLTKFYNYDDMKARRTGSGPTLAYTLVGSKLVVAPVADASYTYRLRFFGKDTDLSTNIENNWLKYAEKLITARLGEVMARFYLHNPVLGDQFLKEVGLARNELILADAARHEAGGMRQMGED